MHHVPLLVASGTLLLAGCATARPLTARSPVTGVRFSVGTVDLPSPAQGVLGAITGVVEFAGGRGRLDVIARDDRPPIAVQGVMLLPPLAGPGDYYLFDSAGFVLVRPSSRTFSAFRLSESSYRIGDVIQARERFMEFRPLHIDTLTASDSARLTQHGPCTLRWHLDRRHATGPAQVLARGWIELPDAPAGEASAVRWFGAAAVLAAMHSAVDTLPRDSLQVTALVVLPTSRAATQGEHGSYVALVVQHLMSGVTSARIDPMRLVLPAGYTERPWAGTTKVRASVTRSGMSADRWRTRPLSSQP